MTQKPFTESEDCHEAAEKNPPDHSQEVKFGSLETMDKSVDNTALVVFNEQPLSPEENAHIDSLLLKETRDEARNSEISDNMVEVNILTSEICLFCNLYDLFAFYSVADDIPEVNCGEAEPVLQPLQVRQAL